MSAVKLVVAGYEASGKTTLISQINNALVMSSDNKAFTAKVPHFRYTEYTGLQDFINTLEAKIEAYKAKFNKLPETIVIDSITHYDSIMTKWANNTFKGFTVYSQLGANLFDMNAYFEQVLIANGINVVLTAHTAFNADTGRYSIPAAGEFGKKGSWLSVTDNGIFIETKNGKRIVHTNTVKFPCRSRLPDYVNEVDIDKYDINDHIAKLKSLITDTEEFVL